MRKATASTLLLVALLISCATTKMNGIEGSRTLLNFLEDGVTTKEEVVLKLGQTSATYEIGRILTYRIGSNDSGYILLPGMSGANWAVTSHSLVLIFDENNVLRKHSLVPVR
ncbi:MAG: hypothetical protein AB9873_07795 [Syntrophobacteraceae bacterium]